MSAHKVRCWSDRLPSFHPVCSRRTVAKGREGESEEEEDEEDEEEEEEERGQSQPVQTNLLFNLIMQRSAEHLAPINTTVIAFEEEGMHARTQAWTHTCNRICRRAHTQAHTQTPK